MDTAKKLRLISSAAGLLTPPDSAMNNLSDVSTTIIGSERTETTTLWSRSRAGVTDFQQDTTSERPMRPMWVQCRGFGNGRSSDDGTIRTVSAKSVDHYRAVPLSDGYHILFTDPRTGCLCLGTDAPIGSVTRLLRKIWFRPPAGASSIMSILYAAGSDTKHGLRIVATFAAADPSALGDTNNSRQMIVFFTVPPDLFHDLSHGNAMVQLNADMLSHEKMIRRQSTSEPWQIENRYREIDVFSEPFQDSQSYPLEICGQLISTCDDLTEIAVDSSPQMVVWAFNSSGLAKTWAMDSGKAEMPTRTAVQQDGGLRLVNSDGDIVMAGDEGPCNLGEPQTSDSLSGVHPFDGTMGPNFVERRHQCDRASWCTRARGSDRMSGAALVDLMEEVNGFTRLDVQLR
ncbi:hypothetical protein QQS21_001185 [Conoideocrella luteorostrata]|uniref:Uncharacterized protein n=1 Tax=Conoideocrella luteorostrata TaxID=1105319 RepID=A0AAJ0G263_9HYPO|nr:hypothetical protein QQS21_001185 [Conoideocrella luteorostrata]